MKCYRIYVEGFGCVATEFSLPMVAKRIDEWSAQGYMATFKREDY